MSIKATLPREEGEEDSEDERPRRERREKREPREQRDRQPRERRERRERNNAETTSYSEDSGTTIGDLIPDELKALFGEEKED